MRAVLLAVGAAIAFAGGGAHATDPQFERRIAEQDGRVRFMADELEAALTRNAPLVQDQALSAYLHGILVRLFGEQAGSMRIYVLRSAVPNAFVAPNGLIVLTTGLLARLDSESQLAMILAHEGEHYLHRHVALSMMSAKINSAAGLLLGVVVGVPLAGQLLAATSYAGFSRDVERAADESGFGRLGAAGVAGGAAPLLFARIERVAERLPPRAGSLV
jgi:beta-barrel assembly-enhancing protease